MLPLPLASKEAGGGGSAFPLIGVCDEDSALNEIVEGLHAEALELCEAVRVELESGRISPLILRSNAGRLNDRCHSLIHAMATAERIERGR